MTVTVTNTTDKLFSDSYNGVRYDFKPNRPVDLPYEAAQHIFGHGLEDKEPNLVRLGWIVTHNDLENGLERLAKFRIKDDGTHRSLSPAVERVPLQSPKGAGGKLEIISPP